ncbi:MAG: flippase-like domain-containing protein [Bdellovibrionaceae bacterium]|nr:flippase-like domain-containing protein [Pseudobdellovibrionaceae bacterium]NUM58951.1 flippase-like domain-containing protein [Pseudobdellovibrionaceae bacterium]
MKLKKYLSLFIKLLIAGGIIYWLATQGKFNFIAIKEVLKPDFILIAVVLSGVNLFILSERWRLLLQTQNSHPKTFDLFKLTLIGTFFNFAMPGGVGGDLVKAFYFYKDNPTSKALAVSSVFIDRLLGLFTIVFMALFVMTLDFQHVMSGAILSKLYYAFGLIFLLFTFGLFCLFSTNSRMVALVTKFIDFLPLKQKFLKLYQSGQLYGTEKKLLFKVFGLSILAQIVAVFIMYVIGQYSASGKLIPLTTYFIVTPIGFMATAIPISPAGVGVGQAAFYFLYNAYLNSTSEFGPLVITIYQMLQLFFGLVGAFFYLQRKDHSQKINEAEINT